MEIDNDDGFMDMLANVQDGIFRYIDERHTIIKFLTDIFKSGSTEEIETILSLSPRIEKMQSEMEIGMDQYSIFYKMLSQYDSGKITQKQFKDNILELALANQFLL